MRRWATQRLREYLVKGFAITLGLGVLISMFSAIVVTRTLLHLGLDRMERAKHPAWFGI